MNDLTVPAPEVSSVQCAPVPPISPGAGPVSGIYAIRCLVNGKVYVGQSRNVKSRMLSHYRKLSSGKHENAHLQRTFSSVPPSEFSWELLECCPVKKLDSRERFWIIMYASIDPRHGFNFESGGNKRKKASEITRRRLSLSHLGSKHSEETKKKMSKTRRGRPHSLRHREKLAAAIRKRILSPESIKKMSLGKRGKPVSDETRRRMSAAQRRRWGLDTVVLAC